MCSSLSNPEVPCKPHAEQQSWFTNNPVQFIFQEQYIDALDHQEPIKYKLNDRYYSPLFPTVKTKNEVFLRRGRITGFEG